MGVRTLGNGYQTVAVDRPRLYFIQHIDHIGCHPGIGGRAGDRIFIRTVFLFWMGLSDFWLYPSLSLHRLHAKEPLHRLRLPAYPVLRSMAVLPNHTIASGGRSKAVQDKELTQAKRFQFAEIVPSAVSLPETERFFPIPESHLLATSKTLAEAI